MVRCFEDENIVHVDGSIDPARDREVITMELVLADLDTVEKRLKKAQSLAKSGDKTLKTQAVFLERLRDVLDSGASARTVVPENDMEAEMMKEMCLLTDKPVLYVANVLEDDVTSGNEYVRFLEQLAA